ncbi:hypothetical protein DXB18_03890 [Clostridium sp. OM02-18AC]|uniref:DUF5677 domain-containing protein n=1 Tax=Clostridium sp. OM02-18AC TaxID=2292311 RepID=UPI000E48F024|nr:DUF5677 domain-containing protein [Clostridium sp. OM02-18AC]RHV68449.1 hypothetical protein DXB18_03890 [Clostridium sp. OM02-18AC]
MEEKAIALYHRIMKRENFETAATDLFHLLVNAQKKDPNVPRILYVDIDGHRNKAGGFDRDMLELQKEFGIDFLLQFFQEVHFPLISVKNTREQNNDIPPELVIGNAENEKDQSLDELYIENYANTEFMSEDNVYDYLKRFSSFLKDYNQWNECNENEGSSETDKLHLLNMWHEHLKDMIMELFNNFLYGNLLSAAAMTRTLIECYVYISILIKEQDPKLIEDWYLCGLMMKVKEAKNRKSPVLGMVKQLCKVLNRDFSEIQKKFDANDRNKNENSWLCDVIGEKRVTFRKACEYLGEPQVYGDFQQLCSFVHGQDVQTKMMPFVFYSSIYTKLYLMSTYIFKSIRLFPIDDTMEQEIQSLELGDQILNDRWE